MIRDLSVQVTLGDGSTLSVESYIQELTIAEGRPESARYDTVGIAQCSLQVSDSLIAEGGQGTYSRQDFRGAPLIMLARAPDRSYKPFWSGNIHSLKYKSPPQGGLVDIAIEAYDQADVVARAAEDVASPRISVTRISNEEIRVSGISDNPSGMVVSDQLLLVVDSGTNRGYAWSISEGTALEESGFPLATTNGDPAGICWDGDSTYWVVDSSDRRAYAYSTVPRHVRDSARDIRTSE